MFFFFIFAIIIYFNIELRGAGGAAIVLVNVHVVVYFEEPGLRDVNEETAT